MRPLHAEMDQGIGDTRSNTPVQREHLPEIIGQSSTLDAPTAGAITRCVKYVKEFIVLRGSPGIYVG